MVGDYKVCIDEATAFLNVAKSCIDSIGEFLYGKMYLSQTACSVVK